MGRGPVVRNWPMATKRVKKAKKRAMQVEFWSDDERQVAAFVDGIRLLAEATFGPTGQNITFSGIGVKALRTRLDEVTWRSANVSGRMRIQDKTPAE